MLFLTASPAVASIAPSTGVGILTEYEWNADGSLKAQANVQDNGIIVTDATTSYDAFGRRGTVLENITGNVNQYRHVYDELGRLRETWVSRPRDRQAFLNSRAPNFPRL